MFGVASRRAVSQTIDELGEVCTLGCGVSRDVVISVTEGGNGSPKSQSFLLNELSFGELWCLGLGFEFHLLSHKVEIGGVDSMLGDVGEVRIHGGGAGDGGRSMQQVVE